jgi:isocitrate lyase
MKNNLDAIKDYIILARLDAIESTLIEKGIITQQDLADKFMQKIERYKEKNSENNLS